MSRRASRTNADKIVTADGSTETAIYDQLFKASNDGLHDEVRRLYKVLVDAGRSEVEVLNRVHSVLYKPPPSRVIYLNEDEPVRLGSPRGMQQRKLRRQVSSRRPTGPKGTRQNAANTKAQSLNGNDANASIDTSLDGITLPVETTTQTNLIDSHSEIGPTQTKSTVEVLPLIVSSSAISNTNKNDNKDQRDGQSGPLTGAAGTSPSRFRSFVRLVAWSPAFSVSVSGLVFLIVAGVLVLKLHDPRERLAVSQTSNSDTSVAAGKRLANTDADAATNATGLPASKGDARPVEEDGKTPSTGNPARFFGQVNVVSPTEVSGVPPLDGPLGFPMAKEHEPQRNVAAPPASSSETAISAATEKASPDNSLSETEVSALVQRGDSLFAQGDVASARLFYERAAIAGNGQAALRLGNSFDNFFLYRIGMGGVHGDLAIATRWYRQALDLGQNDAEVLLNALERK